MIGLTKKQTALVHYILEYQSKHGVSPTVRDIADGVGLSSPGSVQMLIDKLQERGVLRRVRGRARSIEVASTEDIKAFKALQAKPKLASDAGSRALIALKTIKKLVDAADEQSGIVTTVRLLADQGLAAS